MFRKGLVINQKTIKRLSLMNPCRFSLSLRAVEAPLGEWDPFKQTPAKGHLGCFIRFALSVLAPTCCSFPSLISVKSLVSLWMKKLKQILTSPEMIRAQVNSRSEPGSFCQQAPSPDCHPQSPWETNSEHLGIVGLRKVSGVLKWIYIHFTPRRYILCM